MGRLKSRDVGDASLDSNFCGKFPAFVLEIWSKLISLRLRLPF